MRPMCVGESELEIFREQYRISKTIEMFVLRLKSELVFPVRNV